MKLLLPLFILVFAFSAFGQAKKFTFKATVFEDNSSTKSDVESYINRELRSLGDVELVNAPDYYLTVTVREVKLDNRASVGFAVSYVLQEFIECENKPYFTYVVDGLMLGGKDSLRDLSSDIITLIDTEILDKKRKKK